jgi:hypothetical protein
MANSEPYIGLANRIRTNQDILNITEEYESNKWKVIGAKDGKPAKVRSPPLAERFHANGYVGV